MSRPDRERDRNEGPGERYHIHLRNRMLQRGITEEEIEHTLREGWSALDAKAGTEGRVFIFPNDAEWEGQSCEEKEVTVYYKMVGDNRLLLTAKARYGSGFPRESDEDED